MRLIPALFKQKRLLEQLVLHSHFNEFCYIFSAKFLQQVSAVCFYR